MGDYAKPLLDVTSDAVGSDDAFGLAMFGERTYREGDLELVFAASGSDGTGRYALYDLESDPGETRDLAAARAEEVERLSNRWTKYATAKNVIAVDFDSVNTAYVPYSCLGGAFGTCRAKVTSGSWTMDQNLGLSDTKVRSSGSERVHTHSYRLCDTLVTPTHL